jgi:hypothetical protein
VVALTDPLPVGKMADERQRRNPVRIRDGPATVTGERPHHTPRPAYGRKAVGGDDPGARRLRSLDATDARARTRRKGFM